MPSLERVASIPQQLLVLLVPIWSLIKAISDEIEERDLDSVEAHAGKAELTRALAIMSFNTAKHDIMYTPDDDLETIVGIETHCRSVLRLKVAGLLWTAQECTTLIWAARWQTARSKEFPAGHEGNPAVAKANKQVAALTILLLVAWLRDVFFGVENPSSTVLHPLEPFKTLLYWLCGSLKAVRSYMGSFSGETPKPLHCWGTWPMLDQLARRRPKNLKGRLAKKVGKWTNGDPRAMKSSSAYTFDFGCAVGRLLQQQNQPRGELPFFEKKKKHHGLQWWISSTG